MTNTPSLTRTLLAPRGSALVAATLLALLPLSRAQADPVRTPAAALQAGRLAYGHGDYKVVMATD